MWRPVAFKALPMAGSGWHNVNRVTKSQWEMPNAQTATLLRTANLWGNTLVVALKMQKAYQNQNKQTNARV